MRYAGAKMKDSGWLWLTVVFLLIMLVSVLSGCSSTPLVEGEAEALYRMRMRAAADAIAQAELETARIHLTEARSLAMTERQVERVESLEKLRGGAAAMMEGNVEAARVQWSQIEDPDLSNQVRRLAGNMGVSVPTTPLASQEVAP